MRIPSESTDRYMYFVAVDATDLTTRETGLTSFTVYRSRNGTAPSAMNTPTINEIHSTNMPGVYALLLDEDTTLAAGHDTEELALHITHSGMAPVSQTVEIYRPKGTEGQSVTMASGSASANVERWEGSLVPAGNISTVFGTDFANNYDGRWKTNTTHWNGAAVASATILEAIRKVCTEKAQLSRGRAVAELLWRFGRC